MNAKSRKELEASYGKYTRDEMVSALARAQAFIASPEGAKEEAIQGAKDAVEFFNEMIAEFDAPKEQPKPAAKEQTFEEKHAALIQQKVNAGLTRDGAMEVIKHQIANDAKLAKFKKK